MPTTAFDLRASRGLALATGLVVLAAAGAVAASGLPWSARLSAWSLTILGTVHWLRGARAPRFDAGRAGRDGWWLRDPAQREVAAELRHHARIGPFLQLDFRVEGRRFSHLLTPDNSSAETRRRLLLLLSRSRDPLA